LHNYIVHSRFRAGLPRTAKRPWSRGCVGTGTRYCRGPAEARGCVLPSAASAVPFQFAAGFARAARDLGSGTFMPQKVRIALDAMGGDFGASVVIPGAAISLTRHPDSEFLLFGDSKLIDEQLAG